MTSLEVLLWTVPVLFALALLFAILLWCRTWRREEGAETDRRIRLLTAQVTKLSEIVERLEKNQPAPRADESRLSDQINALSAAVARLLSARPGDESPGYSSPASGLRPPASSTQDSTLNTQHSTDRYERMRELLASGLGPVEVARQLDVSLGDVQVIQRLMNLKSK